MKYERALVTGGAGFIGSHLVEELLREGLEVVVLDNLSVGRRDYVPEGAVFVEGSILDKKIAGKAMDGVDVVFHNAARVSIRDSVKNFAKDAETNVLGTVKVLECALSHNIKKFVYASSMAVYGDVDKLPIKEDIQTKPTSPYGVSKLSGEYYCMLLGGGNLDVTVLRYFNTYGVRQTLTPYVGVVTIFINKILSGETPVIFGSGEQIRDFVHVKDVARANVLAMEKSASNQVFNIGSGMGRTINEVAKILAEKINPGAEFINGPQQHGEPSNSIADISRAKKVLGFDPVENIEDRIHEVIEWNRAKK